MLERPGAGQRGNQTDGVSLPAVKRVLVSLGGGILLGAATFAFISPETVATAEVAVALGQANTATTTSPTTTSVATTTSTTTTTVPSRRSLVIHGVGDVNTDTAYIPTLASKGPGYAWNGLAGLFLADDLTVINLECTPSDLGAPLDKEFVFRCPSSSLPAMAAAGIDVASQGNNHAGDHGPEALVDGRANLEAAGILPVGAGADIAEAERPAVVEVGGWTVAVVGFGGVYPSLDWFATPDRPGMADGDTIETMAAAVEAAAAVADLVVVTIHWGAELDTEPRPEDRERAEAMIAAGADVIFGHHSHRLQPLEIVDGVPVAWGLGNFVWPNSSAGGSATAVARVVVAPNGFIEACLLPAFIEEAGHPVLSGDVEC